MAKTTKISDYRTPLKYRLITIVVLITALFTVFSFYTQLSRKAVFFYEVKEGAIVNDKEYSGMILRSEIIQKAPEAGYINFYTREGKRVAAGNNVSSIDESGNIQQYLEDNALSGVNLSDKNLKEIKKELSAFSLRYNDSEFYSIYDAKYNISSSIIELTNFDTLNSLDEVLNAEGGNYLIQTAPTSGIVSFYIDDYSDKDESSIKESDFDSSKYSPNFIKSGELVDKDAAIFKIISSDVWSVIFRLSEEDSAQFADKSSLKVKFRGKDMSLRGAYSTFTSSEGILYGKLVFDKYMIQFENDRFVNFDIEMEDSSGLKIPKKTIVEKEFYTIPLDYLTRGGNSLSRGVAKESTQGGGSEFLPIDVFYEDEKYAYLEIGEDTPLKEGDYIFAAGFAAGSENRASAPSTPSLESKEEEESREAYRPPASASASRYRIGEKSALQGVYNINKGFASFRHVEVLASNEEYYIIKKNTRYGLSVYDHILLDTEGVNEGDFIYQ